MEKAELKRSAEEAGLESEDVEDVATARSKHLAIEKEKANMARQCPYLDTIDRNVLDFGEFGLSEFPYGGVINLVLFQILKNCAR